MHRSSCSASLVRRRSCCSSSRLGPEPSALERVTVWPGPVLLCEILFPLLSARPNEGVDEPLLCYLLVRPNKFRLAVELLTSCLPSILLLASSSLLLLLNLYSSRPNNSILLLLHHLPPEQLLNALDEQVKGPRGHLKAPPLPLLLKPRYPLLLSEDLVDCPSLADVVVYVTLQRLSLRFLPCRSRLVPRSLPPFVDDRCQVSHVLIALLIVPYLTSRRPVQPVCLS
mmetsp:Transcript_22482/g.73775  ORF Transcript_22482/g.73775 Transcript_22482/m.73775 type:complete len:227 (+) Transcript_22482:700-1380(+)